MNKQILVGVMLCFMGGVSCAMQREDPKEVRPTCAICLEEKDDLHVADCINIHADKFCDSCLAQWLSRSNLCPLCGIAMYAEAVGYTRAEEAGMNYHELFFFMGKMGIGISWICLVTYLWCYLVSL